MSKNRMRGRRRTGVSTRMVEESALEAKEVCFGRS
jgi:hypothetical protein